MTNLTQRQLPTPREIVAHLDLFVFGQELAKRDLAVAFYNHYLGIGYHDHHPVAAAAAPTRSQAGAPFGKQHILLMGPTGSGKTYLIRLIAEFLGVPWTFIAATSLVQTGYVGTRIENAIGTLYQSTNRDRRATERGVILIDEVDKIAAHGRTSGPDVSGEGVQQALLSVLDGRVVQVSSGGSSDFVMGEVDTSSILFVCAGAFVGLDDQARRRRRGEAGIGFGSANATPGGGRPLPAARTSAPRPDALRPDDLPDTEDLVRFGFIPELIGRFATISATRALTVDDLVSVLETAEESVLPRQRRLFEVHGIDLDFTAGALRAVAEEACALGTGARGLNRAVLRSLAEIDYRLPELAAEGVTRVTVTAASVRGGKSVDFQRSRSRPRAVRRPGARAGRPGVPGDAAQPACRTVAEDLRAVALAVPESSPQEAASGGGGSEAFTFTDARELTPQQIRKRLDAVKKSLKFGKSMLTARKWWSAFEEENRLRLHVVLRTAEELRMRDCGLDEFFSAYLDANTDNIHSVLLFLDYRRSRDEWERKRKAPTE
ncbi:MAG: AAA family ATPase [bacterium]|nr:AAA family ATPase [bacterium]